MKTVLVVGASSGIGLATTRLLLEKGMRVCATFHTKENALETLHRDFGSAVLEMRSMDVTQETSVQTTVSAFINTWGIIDAVIYLPSAPIKPTPAFHVEWNDIEQHLTVQAQGFFSIFSVLKKQIQQKQPVRFVATLTEMCFGAPPLAYLPYIAGKYALMGLAKSLAVEVGRFGSAVNMVSPGMVETSLLKNVSRAAIEQEKKANPRGQLTSPLDVARAIAFLVSDESAHLNGVNIVINGGSSML